MIFFENLRKYDKEVVHGMMEERDGPVNPFSNPRTSQNVMSALKRLEHYNFRDKNLVFAEQVHGNNVCFCPKDSGYIKLGVDALVSKTKKQILVIKTADCLPILFYDPIKKIVGAIHAGRKGLAKGIIGKSIKASKADPDHLIVGIGPHIRKCCYFLRGPVLKKYSGEEFKDYIETRQGKTYLDLTKIAIDQLIKFGVKAENIEDSQICTFCQGRGRFYSARRSEIEGKEAEERFPCFGSFIGLI